MIDNIVNETHARIKPTENNRPVANIIPITPQLSEIVKRKTGHEPSAKDVFGVIRVEEGIVYFVVMNYGDCAFEALAPAASIEQGAEETYRLALIKASFAVRTIPAIEYEDLSKTPTESGYGHGV